MDILNESQNRTTQKAVCGPVLSRGGPCKKIYTDAPKRTCKISDFIETLKIQKPPQYMLELFLVSECDKRVDLTGF